MPEHQGVIELKVRRPVIHLDESVISRIPNEQAALKMNIEAAGLNDGVLADELTLDPGQFSRIKNGNANFPSRHSDLYDICGSEIHLQYLLWIRGYEVVPRRRKSQVEVELEEARKELEIERMKNKVLTEAIRGVQ